MYETGDFYGRALKVKTSRTVFLEARERDIPENLDKELGALGITYASDFFEYTQKIAKEGIRAKNLEVLFEFPFCYQVISAVGSENGNVYEEYLVLVSPSITKTSNLVLGKLSKIVTKVSSCSIPQELAYLQTAAFGIDKIIPKLEFEGDIGEDGRPLDHFTSLAVQPVKEIIFEGRKYELHQIINKPILIGNMKFLVEEEVKRLVDEIIWTVNSRRQREWKSIKILGKDKWIKIKSHDVDILSDIISTGHTLILEKKRSKAFSKKNCVALIKFDDFDIKNIKLQKMGICPQIISFKSKVRKSKLSKTLKSLEKKGVKFVIFYGKKEASQQSVTLKIMKDRRQELIKTENLIDALRKIIFNIKRTKNKHMILIQETGYPAYERRLFESGKEYLKSAHNLTVIKNHIPREEGNNQIKVIKVNYRDMTRLILGKNAEEAILGYDRLLECLAKVGKLSTLIKIDQFNSYMKKNNTLLRLENLKINKCTLALAAPTKLKWLSIQDLLGQEINTEYPHIAEIYCNQVKVEPKIRVINGCAEVYPSVIIDTVSSGQTLLKNNKEIRSELFDSYAVLIYQVRFQELNQIAVITNELEYKNRKMYKT